ncbi:serine/threonine protein kinase [Marinicrinis sediminis]|uniref:Serine/threonine protein kinase n=1 Tax=Marinicrinis sediminis TaxID=1652465 RepID=A0ABW5RFF9_9BACL
MLRFFTLQAEWFRHVWEVFVVDRPYEKGKQIRSYEIMDFLGAGGYGMAYLVRHRSSGERYVMKQLRPSSKKNKQGLRAHQNEIDMLSQLHHPAIPTLVEQFEWQQQEFVVMAWVEGATFWEQIFEQGVRYSHAEAFQMLHKLLDIVQHIHQKGIVHRDLRIPNVIVHEDRLFVIDFGLACKQDDSRPFLWEQTRQDPAFDPRKAPFCQSDHYALAHLVLFLLYSSYEPAANESERSWQEELGLPSRARQLLERMLQVKAPFRSTEELSTEVENLIKNHMDDAQNPSTPPVS